jgi:hypothetical protein
MVYLGSKLKTLKTLAKNVLMRPTVDEVDTYVSGAHGFDGLFSSEPDKESELVYYTVGI